MKITKLFFFSSIAVTLLAGMVFASPDKDSSYSIVILGDVHFDGPETNTYHSATGKWSENRIKEFKRNVGMWQTLMPGLLDSAGKAAKENNSKFAIQLGDIAQGDCPNQQTHSNMVATAFHTLKAHFPEIPLLPTMGNHDFRSPNGRKAYIDAMSPLLSKELGENTKAPNYVVHQGPDVFIFVDFNVPQTNFIKQALADSKDARYVFVASHGLLIPDSDSDWFLLGRGTKRDVREEFRKLFAEHHVIGLSGHVHRTEFIDVDIDGGQISQLVASSVRTDNSRDSIDQNFGEKPEDYGLSKYHNGKFPGIMKPYAPGVKSYYSTRAAGYVILKVSDSGITAEFHPGESAKPEKTFKIR